MRLSIELHSISLFFFPCLFSGGIPASHSILRTSYCRIHRTLGHSQGCQRSAVPSDNLGQSRLNGLYCMPLICTSESQNLSAVSNRYYIRSWATRLPWLCNKHSNTVFVKRPSALVSCHLQLDFPSLFNWLHSLQIGSSIFLS